MNVKVNSLVHLLALAPGLVALIMAALGSAPFEYSPAVTWGLLLFSAIAVYAGNGISSVFSSTKPPDAPTPVPPAA